MTKVIALENLDNLYTHGFISQDVYTQKVARVEEIAANRDMHYSTKNNRYLAVVAMTKNGI